MLNKKIWYLRNQGTVATTDQNNHQAADQAVLTVQKKRFPHPAENLQVRINPTANAPQKVTVKNQARKNLFRRAKANPMAAKAAAITKAALPVARKKAFRHANHIQDGQPIVTTAPKEALAAMRRAKKNRSPHRAANPTPAG